MKFSEIKAGDIIRVDGLDFIYGIVLTKVGKHTIEVFPFYEEYDGNIRGFSNYQIRDEWKIEIYSQALRANNVNKSLSVR